MDAFATLYAFHLAMNWAFLSFTEDLSSALVCIRLLWVVSGGRPAVVG
jgi:hypothetical protein